MIDRRFLAVLRQVHTRLASTDVNWAVTGSLGFALQGIPVEPHDIDIQSDEKGVYEIERLFSEYVARPVALSSNEAMRSHFGALSIDGLKVEIMGDIQKRSDDGAWQEPTDLNRHKRIVEIEGMGIPVLSLEYEYQAYLKLGRTERAEMLKNWMPDPSMKAIDLKMRRE